LNDDYTICSDDGLFPISRDPPEGGTLDSPNGVRI